jgi:pimeloyl-ACP methyl ester carboxylesterase
MKKVILVALLGLLSLTACEKEEFETNQVLYLRHKGADMPIYVAGETSSRVIILFLHGGPFSGAVLFNHWFKALQKKYVVALWDQRAAGSSNGKVDQSTLHYEQYAEDCSYVVKLLKQKYPGTKIFLMGHSFGVELGWQYLTTLDWQNQIAGYIAVNGAHSGFSYHYYQREWVLQKAQEKDKQTIYQWALAHPVTQATLADYDVDQLYDYMVELGGDETKYFTPGLLLKRTFFSPAMLGGFAVNNVLTSPEFKEEKINRPFKEFDKSSALVGITIPVGLFWGEKDGNVRIEVGRETYQLLTNSPKRFVTFPDSWHSPMETENEAFTRQTIGFIEQYR